MDFGSAKVPSATHRRVLVMLIGNLPTYRVFGELSRLNGEAKSGLTIAVQF
jgi:hypothetical protein